MLPVVIAAGEHQPLLRPDDLATDREAAGDEALGHLGCVQRRRAKHRRRRQETAPKPRASRPGRRSAPCRSVASLRRRPCSARRGRTRPHRAGRSPSGAASRRLAPPQPPPGSVLSPQTSRCRPSSHTSPKRDTGTAGASGASSGSVQPGAPGQQRVDVPEADQVQIEAGLVQRPQLRRDQVVVPARVQRQLVVGQHVGAPLLLASSPSATITGASV